MLLSGKERPQCIQSQVWVGRDSVHAQRLERGAGVGGGSMPHVVELGVEDDGQVAGDARDEVLKRVQARGPLGQPEAQVGLVGAGQVGSGLDDGAAEGEQWALGASDGVGQPVHHGV